MKSFLKVVPPLAIGGYALCVLLQAVTPKVIHWLSNPYNQGLFAIGVIAVGWFIGLMVITINAGKEN